METTNHKDLIYLSSEFKDWLKDQGFSEGSIRSYLSWLKIVGTEIRYKKINNRPIFEIIEILFRRNSFEKAYNLLIGLVGYLSYKINNPDKSKREKSNLQDIRSAVKKYISFIQEKIEETDNSQNNAECEKPILVLDTDIKEENETIDIENEIPIGLGIEPYNSIEPIGKAYSIDILRDNFFFRITTQDRMSKRKKLFFPIRLIKMLFYSNGKKYIKNARNLKGENKEWFDKTINNIIDNIILHTEQNNYKVREIKEILFTPDSSVLIKLNDNSLIQLFTYDELMASKHPITANKLNDLHIDHVNLINKLLEENADKYKGLYHLTTIIKSHANEMKINSSNSNKIYQRVLERNYDEVKNLIPLIKNDLEEISKAELQIMHSKHNLRKK